MSVLARLSDMQQRTDIETYPRPDGTVDGVFHHVLGPVAGGVAAAILGGGEGAAFESGVLTFLVLMSASVLFDPEPRWAALLPFMRIAKAAMAPMLGLLGLFLLQAAMGLPDGGAVTALGAFGAASGVALAPILFSRRYWRSERSIRAVVIGSAGAAEILSRELALAGLSRYLVVGRIATPGEEPPGEDEVLTVRTLGTLGELSDVVAEHRVHLLVMSGEVPRLQIFDEVASTCLHLPVRLWELSGFYEEVFGHVPVAEINASWFQYIMHPRYRPSAPASKRVLDVAAALLLGLFALPLMLLLALLIKRDGGPALFRQVRIGEGGQPFILYKLRTMRVGASSAAQWASADDPRVTRVGRLLRKTHVDELPQLINVLRGEMSLVGPRPEQPEFVGRLEQVVPYYQRRHLLRPGITGWAQVRCGYAGSDVGSAWKLCHDLYYLKHRSLTLDLVILGETLRTLVADRQHAVEPNSVSFILGPAPDVSVEPAAAVAGS